MYAYPMKERAKTGHKSTVSGIGMSPLYCKGQCMQCKKYDASQIRTFQEEGKYCPLDAVGG